MSNTYPIIVQNAKTRELSVEYIPKYGGGAAMFPMPDWAVIVLFVNDEFHVGWTAYPWGYTWPEEGTVELKGPIWELVK